MAEQTLRTLPGISDAERLEELKERLRYAEDNLQDAENDLVEARDIRLDAWVKRNNAKEAYVAHLEMMAAGVSK